MQQLSVLDGTRLQQRFDSEESVQFDETFGLTSKRRVCTSSHVIVRCGKVLIFVADHVIILLIYDSSLQAGTED